MEDIVEKDYMSKYKVFEREAREWENEEEAGSYSVNS